VLWILLLQFVQVVMSFSIQVLIVERVMSYLKLSGRFKSKKTMSLV